MFSLCSECVKLADNLSLSCERFRKSDGNPLEKACFNSLNSGAGTLRSDTLLHRLREQKVLQESRVEPPLVGLHYDYALSECHSVIRVELCNAGKGCFSCKEYVPLLR